MTNSSHLVFNRYKLVDSRPLFDIFLGKNEREQDSLLFRVNQQFPDNLISELTSTSMMSINLIQQENQKTLICFDLLDTNYQALFFSFANNMIDYVIRQSNVTNTFVAIVFRYTQWQKLLKANRTGLLTVERIRGLIGELLFIHRHLTREYGTKKSLSYWKGPLGADQDFRTENIWYEIKTIASGNDTILVSSIEQLDSERFGAGEIVIFSLDTTVLADPEAITIRGLINEIKQDLNEQDACNLDDFLFTNLGYYDKPEYETGHYVVRLSSTQRFAINDTSPVIRRSTIPSAVVSLTYNISLASLMAFKVE